MTKLEIDVVTDIVCPWCLIGLRRLTQALEALPEVEAELRFHPFLLDPTTPDEGRDLRETLRAKIAGPVEPMFERVEAAARESGIPLDFAKVARSPSTLRAHTLARHAATRGTQQALTSALFDAYFLEGRDVGNLEVLLELASAHGFEADEARALLADEDELRTTREHAASMAGQGIRGVPFFILGGRLALSGAQPVETMKDAIERALAEAS